MVDIQRQTDRMTRCGRQRRSRADTRKETIPIFPQKLQQWGHGQAGPAASLVMPRPLVADQKHVSKSTHFSNSRISGAAYANVPAALRLELVMEVLAMIRARPTSHILAESRSLDNKILPLLISLCTICRQHRIHRAAPMTPTACDRCQPA